MNLEDQVRKEYENLTRTLITKKLTITTMESCTSGEIASLITDTEGSSAVIKGAFVTYSNEAKVMNGVSEKILDTYTVYSEETAKAMAEACQKTYQADIGIGVTGTMGNIDPANVEASVPGEVYYAIAYKGKTEAYHVTLKAEPSRFLYKMAVADQIYRSLMDRIR